jgi:Ca2+-binding RTX toxin-like protein
MVRALFSTQGALSAPQENSLVGLTDLLIAQNDGQSTLFAVTRGGGYLTSFDLGGTAGRAQAEAQWLIDPDFLQLTQTDLVFLETGAQTTLFMAGLASNDLPGVRLDLDGTGSPFRGAASVSNSVRDLGDFTAMSMFSGTNLGVAALRDGGLVNVSFSGTDRLAVSNIDEGSTMRDVRASEIITTNHNGQNFAFVSYGSNDTIGMFRQETGVLRHVADASVENGLWADRPGAMAVTQDANGTLYVIAAASGSGSLSLLEVSADGSTFAPVDHLIDNLDTRFANASHVTSVTVEGHNFVLTAGNDQGISLLTVLPGGRLQHIDAMPASAEAPLRGITALEAMATPDGIRVWASTESAPFLSEFSVTLPNLGDTLVATSSGALSGGGQDDILIGSAAADIISGNSGDDILVDGAGIDRLSGGNGSDLFIMMHDDMRDTITDFDVLTDRIDLSDYSALENIGTLTVTSRSWGAEVNIAGDVLEVRTSNGSRLSASDFTPQNLIQGNRIETDASLYPTGGSTPDPQPDPEPDPDPGPEPDPDPGTPVPGSPAGTTPVGPAVQGEPILDLTWRSGDTRGGNLGEVFTGFGANDRLFGNGGNDTFNAGAGNDVLSGDTGNDLLNGMDGDDIVSGGTGNDTATGGNGADTIFGDQGNDSITGNDGADMLIGGAGNDRIEGNGDNDRMWGSDGADRLFGGNGNDMISAGSNAGFSVDGVWGEGGNDTLLGNEDTDLLNGGAGNDVLDGGTGQDKLFGGEGNDLLFGGEGFDRLFGGEGNDRLSGGDGGDGLFGQAGNDTLWGGTGDDRFFAGTGNDVLDGGTGRDTLSGDDGRDTLYGGTGNDQLEGGTDADVFVFSDGHGDDVVADFDSDELEEELDLAQITGINDFDDVLAASGQVGSGVLIRTGTDSSIFLENVNRSDLTEDDFAF